MTFDYSDNYGIEFGNLAERMFKRRIFPKDLLEVWRDFVEKVEDGYDDIPPEYDNDLNCARDYLQVFLDDNLLSMFPEHDLFKSITKELDFRFIKNTQVSPLQVVKDNQWWDNRIPLRATKEYVDFSPSWLERLELKVTIVEKCSS